MPAVGPLLTGDPAEIGGYRLEGRLGAGGQGVVYLGRTADGAPVAVKLLHEPADGGRPEDEDARRRFAREIAAARRVAPFCVAWVLDFDLDGPRPYVVSEYVEGPTLQRAGRRSGPALHRLAVATATALAAVHQAGIVHRDFKPANVLLGPDGPRVVDFGVARRLGATTATGGTVGTPAYMAPEQIAGEPPAPAWDVFAWGGVMVFAATGRPPFGDDTLPAVLNRVLTKEPDLGDLEEPLRSIVALALRKNPAERPGILDITMRLLAAVPEGTAGDVPGVLTAAGHAVYPEPDTVPSRRSSGRRRGLLAGAAVTLAAATTGAVLLSVLPSEGVADGDARHEAAAVTPAPSPGTTLTQTTTQAPATRVPLRFTARFAGVWRGRVDYEPGAYDTLVLTVPEGGDTVTEQFVDYRCTGRSKLQVVSGTTVRLKRVSMRGNCVRNGTIYLTVHDNGTMTFDYNGHGENEVTKNEPFYMIATLKRT
ncbi:serine/threonine-protein kinase [Microbispora sp. KK1-11]|uniref:serine/threonine-protein kinase n=1 Tax=Microbispora sp. KK1-11 TaxID=2053005 RepID=UPI0011591554|nr:serine/threonine-protein kinase [Microbispora sp. KK1-11]TQS29211.1 serine/threonine protein kinase [Microbispora sp. KK1-11]